MDGATRAQQLKIPDLRRPVLTDAQRMVLAQAESNPIELSGEAVVRAARQATGLDDFGAQDFLERLEVWLAEVRDDPNRTAWSRHAIFAFCLRNATNRLRVTEVLKQHPEIDDLPLVAPVVVVGLPRSGTTHLVNLIAADSRFRSLPLWESLEPVATPHEGPGRDGLDPRFVRCQQQWEATLASRPYLAAMHPMNPDHIHEELELQGIDFSSYNLEWRATRAPNWRDYYLAHDQTPHYAYMRALLKLLQWMRGPDRWVLKCPQHLEQIGPLMATFPDATVVVTHRDPVAAIQSAATMHAYNSRMTFKEPDIDLVCEYWTDRIERLLRAGVRDLAAIPAGRRVDVAFGEFMADDVGMVEQIYEQAGIEMTATARAQIESHMADHPRGKFGEVVYDLRGDFGVEPADMRQRFGFYFDAFTVAPEVA
jgi:hypothetical protein